MTGKQLKNAILQLAIQGKLVPQDAADEPASALLAQIRKEKEQLVKAGKLKPACRQAGKKDLETTPINDEEKPFDIPESWEWVRLGEYSEIITGSTPSKLHPEYYGKEYPFYKPSELDQGINVCNSTDGLSKIGYESTRKTPAGSVLVTCIGATIGKTGLITKDGSCNQQINAILPSKIWFSNSLFYFCNSAYFQNLMRVNAAATTLPIMNKSSFSDKILPLPPLAEQHRIVSKIEELMPLVEEYGVAQEKLNRLNEALPEALKKSILQQAIQGKLVPPACRLAGRTLPTSQLPTEETGVWYVYVIECEDGSFYKGFTTNLQKRYKEHCSGRGAEWTKKHKPKQLYYYEIQYSEEEALKREKYLKSGFGREWFKREVVDKSEDWEPASALLAQIRKEKEQLVKAGKLKPACRQAGKKDLETTPITDEEKPFEIPESWEWCRLGEIFSHNNGKQLNRADTKGELHDYITTSNLYWDSFDLKEIRQMLFTDEELVRCTATKGDLLVCEGGDVGRSAIWDKDFDICIQNHIHRLRAYCQLCTRYFLYLLMFNKSTGLIGGKGIGIQGLSAKALHNILVALPPLAEQKRIVARVEELMKLVEGMK